MQDELSGAWSRARLVALIAACLALAILVARLQRTSFYWSGFGHSMIPWLAIALLPAHAGTRRQSLIATPVTCVLVVGAYYLTLTLSGYYRPNAELFARTTYWSLAAAVAGVILVLLSREALRPGGPVAWVARGCIVGLIIGAAIDSVVGSFIFHEGGPAILVASLRQGEPQLLVAIVVSVCYLAHLAVRRVPRPELTIALLPLGFILGWAVVTIPDFAYDVLR